MKYNIGEHIEPIDEQRDWVVNHLHLTPGKSYEVLGVARGHVHRDHFLVEVEDDRGSRKQIHESWFKYSASNITPAQEAQLASSPAV